MWHMEELFRYLRQLVKKNGPDESDYHELNSWINDMIEKKRAGGITDKQFAAVREILGDAFSLETCQGLALLKPHGYAGDFEILDRLYTKHVSPLPHYRKWDEYYHHHEAAQAVRNRCGYLKRVIAAHAKSRTATRVLNLGSGPGRDMSVYFASAKANGSPTAKFDCIDHDESAIRHARTICQNYLERITFTKANILSYSPPAARYDIIWSSGVFDYFNDRIFVRVLKRFLPALKRGGEFVIGNFSEANPTKSYMEMLEWHLHHRTPERLREIALRAGVLPDNIKVKKEKTGVNLFLHIAS
jgi:extracellular factor (EF) 3-hydroxypalmitic acid methyl ester biosynthesis protein